jgi:hypothetical protein
MAPATQLDYACIHCPLNKDQLALECSLRWEDALSLGLLLKPLVLLQWQWVHVTMVGTRALLG